MRFQITALFALVASTASAQIGYSMKKVNSHVDSAQILRTKTEGRYIVQDIVTGKNEVAMFYYNRDSIAIMVAVSRKDSFYNFSEMVNFTKHNVPKYRAQVKCMQGTTTFHLDSVRHILFMVNYDMTGSEPRVKGFGVVVDQEIISSWTKGLTAWIKE